MVKQFNISNIEILISLNYTVSVIANFKEPGNIPVSEAENLRNALEDKNVTVYDIEIKRNPFNPKNIRAYNKIKRIIDLEKFSIIHSHSPIGGALARLAAKESRKRYDTRSVYTAHGFHFFKGSSVINWVLFYPIEKYLSKFTDTLITINTEDYENAKKFFSGRLEYIHGVGIDTDKFDIENFDYKIKMMELGIPSKKWIVLSVGELNNNKNHQVIIKALAKLNNQSIHYVIVGMGKNLIQLRNMVKTHNLESNVHFLGYQNNINEIYQIANVFAFPSYREGLGLVGVEALAAGLPLITSNVRGINDYSIHGITGYTFKPDDIEGFAKGLNKLYHLERTEIEKIRLNNIKNAKRFDKDIVDKKMVNIYNVN